MNHWLIAPIVLPAILAPILAFVTRHDIPLSRTFSVAGTAALALISIGLTILAAGGETHVYELGAWPGPFGIVLVLDRLSALMLLVTTLLALIVLLYAIGSGWDRRGWHFHALYQFQLMGLCGAFLTGDAFNLFVFFEVLLIASYGLMIHGGQATRLRAGLQYVVMNLVGSTLFLFALGTLYATTGTLNIADLAVKVGQMPQSEAALLRVAAMLLMIVFALKAAIFPFQFWLPLTYSNAPAPVAALFAVMTKVGAYAILRFHSAIFGPDVTATGSMAADWLLPAALATLVVGVFGVLGARRLQMLVSFSIIGSMGTLLIAISLFTPESAVAAVYYLVHSTFVGAALFLIADLVVTRRGSWGDALVDAPRFAQSGLLAALFFGAAIASVGLPPLSGFLGKLLILDAARSAPEAALIWGVILSTSLLMLVGMSRAGSVLFWKSAAVGPVLPELDEAAAPPAGPPLSGGQVLAIAAAMLPLGVLVALTLLAGPVSAYLQDMAGQLHAPEGYIAAVLGRG